MARLIDLIGARDASGAEAHWRRHVENANKRWLTGYDQAGLQRQIDQESDFAAFFAEAPGIHPNCSLIKGIVCGVRVEEIEDPLMRSVRYLDKLIDELAKGKAMEKILRT